MFLNTHTDTNPLHRQRALPYLCLQLTWRLLTATVNYRNHLQNEAESLRRGRAHHTRSELISGGFILLHTRYFPVSGCYLQQRKLTANLGCPATLTRAQARRGEERGQQRRGEAEKL